MKRVFFSFYVFLLVSLLFLNFVLGPVIGKMAKAYLRDSSNEYSRQLARGVFHMMTEDLQRLPREQWPERIRVLAPRFGYDIALLPLAELPLAEEHLRLLRQGGIAVVDEGERLYQQIGDSGLVLKKGPFSVLAPDLPGHGRSGGEALSSVEAIADWIAALLDVLDARWPGIRDRVADSTPRIRRHLNVFVDGRKACLETPLAADSELLILTAMSGG